MLNLWYSFMVIEMSTAMKFKNHGTQKLGSGNIWDPTRRNSPIYNLTILPLGRSSRRRVRGSHWFQRHYGRYPSGGEKALNSTAALSHSEWLFLDFFLSACNGAMLRPSLAKNRLYPSYKFHKLLSKWIRTLLQT